MMYSNEIKSSSIRPLILSIFAGFVAGCVIPVGPAFAQTSPPLTPLTSCEVSECRFSQSSGTTNSVGVGVSGSIGVSASVNSTAGLNSSANSSLVLDSLSASEFGNYNSSIQSIGNSDSNSPVNVKITSDSIQLKSLDGDSKHEYNQSSQATSADLFKDENTSKSNADFTADGFSASQDFRFKGTSYDSSGSQFNATVTPYLNKDATGNVIFGKDYLSGNGSANAESRSRFQADITTSTFVNAFTSSF